MRKIIVLKDIQTLEDVLQETGQVSTGLELIVDDEQTYGDVKVTSFKDSQLLLVEVFGLKLIMFEPGVMSGNRKDFIDADERWIFEEQEFIDYNDLQFSRAIVDNEDIEYKVWHECNSCYSEMLSTFVFYKTEDEVRNNHILIFEYGDMDNDYGGLIRFLQGAEIKDSELEIMER